MKRESSSKATRESGDSSSNVLSSAASIRSISRRVVASGQLEWRKGARADGASSTAASKIRLISCQASGDILGDILGDIISRNGLDLSYLRREPSLRAAPLALDG